MEEYIVKVVSYKRPYNKTCKALLETSINWEVFVYSFDPYIEEYKKLYTTHVREITEFDKANLPRKRQLVLDTTLKEHYDYCIMLDDDIEKLSFLADEFGECSISLNNSIFYMLAMMKAYDGYVALSCAYNKSNNNNVISDYKNICNNSIFNMKEYKKHHKVKYNPDSRCEDMEFTIDLILDGAKSGKLEKLIIKNTLQGGTTNDGLSYRFSNTNRFIEEGGYMQRHYPKLKDVFEYDESHFKMNTEKLIKELKL